MAFDWSEPTPTIQEFVYSFHPVKWAPDSLEDLLYWEIKGAVLVGPPAVRTAMMMRAGMSLEAAGYAATQNSIGLYRLMRKGRAVGIVATSPILAAGTLALASALYVHSSPAPTEAHRSEPGQTSWWRSVSQALTGTGPGIGGANIGL